MDRKEEFATQIEQEEFATPPYPYDLSLGNLGQKIGEVRVANGAFPEDKRLSNSCSDYSSTQLTCCILYFG